MEEEKHEPWRSVSEDIHDPLAMAFCPCGRQLPEIHDAQVDLLLSMPHGVIIVDARSHEIIDVNPQAMLMIGASRELVVGRQCHQFICPRRKGQCPITDLGKGMDRSETVLLTADGGNIPVLKSVVEMELYGRTALIESFVDLTEQKEAEALRMEREKFKGVVEMAGAICHEFNQPLMALAGYTDLMRLDAEAGRPVLKNISRIQQQTDRLGALTKKLLEITSYRTKSYLNRRIVDFSNATESPESACRG